MSRDELNARALAELDALERILAREPVAEEHLELAALVDSVRGCAMKMRPEFSAELAARFEGRGRRLGAGARSSLHTSRRWLGGGRLAFAGGGAVAAAVALTILLSGGVRDALFGGGSTHGTVHTLSPSSGAAKNASRVLRSGAPSTVPHSTPSLGTPEIHQGAGVNGVGATATAPAPSAAATPGSSFAANPPRLIARGSSLTLASPPSQMQAVANQIVAATEQQGGVVEHSNVDVSGPGSYASFSLAVPSGHLGRLIATLSSLASVRALNQTTQDITSSYQGENALLARRLKALASLRTQLATAASATAAADLRKQIGAVEHRITIERATIARLRGEASNATLSVQVVPGAAAKKHAVAVSPLTRAYHDALHALQEILAIALVVLAILLPFALCGLALWWAAAGVRQRARERAMRAAH
ncbi:MAG TPA: DUF4349 domain-containing protein [Solirubrobacteraceae bacterium]|nr:DUF4349 domain-containing protein [Solirubrobacteraceae bacterium]